MTDTPTQESLYSSEALIALDEVLFAKKKGKASKELAELDSKIASYTSELGKLHFARYETALLMGSIGSGIAMEDQLEMIRIGFAFEAVELVKPSGGREILLYLYTGPKWVRHPETGDYHFLGKFKIMFRIHQNSAIDFGFYNLFWRIKVGADLCHQHPHVWGDGSQCLGNIQADMVNCVASGDLLSLAGLANEYVGSVNVNDGAGAKTKYWPFVPATQFAGPETPANLLQYRGPVEFLPPVYPMTNQAIEEKVSRHGTLTAKEISKLLSGRT